MNYPDNTARQELLTAFHNGQVEAADMMYDRLKKILTDYPDSCGDVVILDEIERIRADVVNQCIILAENFAKNYSSIERKGVASAIAMNIYAYFQSNPGVRPPA